jgi:hypothetical protein
MRPVYGARSRCAAEHQNNALCETDAHTRNPRGVCKKGTAAGRMRTEVVQEKRARQSPEDNIPRPCTTFTVPLGRPEMGVPVAAWAAVEQSALVWCRVPREPQERQRGQQSTTGRVINHRQTPTCPHPPHSQNSQHSDFFVNKNLKASEKRCFGWRKRLF